MQIRMFFLSADCKESLFILFGIFLNNKSEMIFSSGTENWNKFVFPIKFELIVFEFILCNHFKFRISQKINFILSTSAARLHSAGRTFMESKWRDLNQIFYDVYHTKRYKYVLYCPSIHMIYNSFRRMLFSNSQRIAQLLNGNDVICIKQENDRY